MSRNIVIIGNSGAARECHWFLREVMTASSGMSFKGFLSFEGYKGNLMELSHLELGIDDDYTPAPQDEFIIGLGSPALRAKVFHKWKARGARFMNLIHPLSLVSESASMGEGNIITVGCILSCNTNIGHANFLNGHVIIGHDVNMGDANFFGPGSKILGSVSIGSVNSFGTNSVALVKARIGDNNMIAPGAYIYKGCRDNCLMSGNPARKIAATGQL